MTRKDFDFKYESKYQSPEIPNSVSYGFTAFEIILAGIVLVLIAVYIVRFNDGGFTIPTFTSLLEMLSKAPDLSISLETIGTINFDWGLFNFLRDFFNVYIKIFNFILWLADNLLICLEYIFYFLRWIFVG